VRIVRFATQSKIKYGVLGNNTVHGMRGSPFARFKGPGTSFPLDGSTYDVSAVKLLSPCLPSKVVAVGLNYRSHSEEIKMTLPSVPLIFIKPTTAVIGPDDEIVFPPMATRVDYEGELGVVIGRQAKDVPRSESKDYVLGYTCFNDVTERNIQKADGQWTRAKGFDTFAPMGPWIETDVAPDDLKIETRLNGELCQSARTTDLIFGVSELIEFISGVMTLLPGDVIATGTPSGIGGMNAGDVVKITIEKVGTLRNRVVSPR
jgi:2-keto-4-pentenoate hydratase/2-oxohepta-3-ene-1,7-dioic acid hydratase in catechol pathway